MILGGIIIYLVIGLIISLLNLFILYYKDAHRERYVESSVFKETRFYLIMLFYPAIYFIIIFEKLYEKLYEMFDDLCYKIVSNIKGDNQDDNRNN